MMQPGKVWRVLIFFSGIFSVVTVRRLKTWRLIYPSWRTMDTMHHDSHAYLYKWKSCLGSSSKRCVNSWLFHYHDLQNKYIHPIHDLQNKFVTSILIYNRQNLSLYYSHSLAKNNLGTPEVTCNKHHLQQEASLQLILWHHFRQMDKITRASKL